MIAQKRNLTSFATSATYKYVDLLLRNPFDFQMLTGDCENDSIITFVLGRPSAGRDTLLLDSRPALF